MSLAEPPNTISHHPDISAYIRLITPEGLSDGNQELFIAGQAVQGVLQINTAVEGKLCLGKIELELVAREDARTRSDALGRIFWTKQVVFQGPGLPPCSAVFPERSSSLANGHYPARKGTASFPIHIPLPVGLPTSFASNTASITYSLILSIELAFAREKRVLRSVKHLQVISHPSSFRPEALMEAVGRGELDITGQHGGRVILEINNGDRRAWGVEGRETVVHAQVTNMTAYECRAVSAKLVRQVKVHSGEKELMSFETVEVDEDLARHFAAPFNQGVFSAGLILPSGQRSIPDTPVGTSIAVTYILKVTVQTISVSQHKVTASLPIEIYHPASLPSELWLETITLSNAVKGSGSHCHGRVGNPKRWSIPTESGYFVPRAPLPSPPESVSGLLRRLSYGGSSMYSQPAWVVHLPPVMEEVLETRAERTSRHLRETSEHRGRSVSPPLFQTPATPPRLRRPPSAVNGPRPAPSRSLSNVEPIPLSTMAPATLLPEVDTPPLLSPIPMSIEPNSYFDQQVHSLTPETPLDISRLCHATVVSLENFAESFDSPTLEGNPRADMGANSSRAFKGALSSPTGERRSVMSVFEVEEGVSSRSGRPEAKRRESSERKVAVESRHRRDASHTVEVENFDEAADECTPVLPVTHGITPVQSIIPGQSHFLVTPAHPHSDSGSIRGRGGQVAVVKDIFTALERATFPPTSAAKKIRRKSVPPAYPATAMSDVPQAQVKRHSMAVAPSSVSQPISQAIVPIARSILEAPSPIKRHSYNIPPIPPLQWNGGRPAKNTFEKADLKEGKTKRGAVGKLKALIERFDRRRE